MPALRSARLPGLHRSPYIEGEEEDDEGWSDTPSAGKSDEYQDERSWLRAPVNLRRTGYQHGHPLHLGDIQDGSTGDFTSYVPHQSYGRSQAVPYYANPFDPTHRPNTRTSQYSRPPPLNPHSQQAPFSGNSYSGNTFPAPPTPYHTNSPFNPSYDRAPDFRPPPPMTSTYHMEQEMENMEQDMENMEQDMESLKTLVNTLRQEQIASRKQEKDRERAKRKQEEAAGRAETRRRKEEKIQQQVAREVKAELAKKLPPKREVKDDETLPDLGRRRLEYSTRELLEYILAERQIEENRHMREDMRAQETNLPLLSFVESIEDKMRRQGWRDSRIPPVRGNGGELSRSRPEILPGGLYQNRTDEDFRSQVEDIVMDMLQLRVEGETQQTNFASDRPLLSLTRQTQRHQPPLPLKLVPRSLNFASEGGSVSVCQRCLRNCQYGNCGDTGTDATPSGSLGLQSPSSHTAINSSDQYSPSESSRRISHSHRFPTSRRNGTPALNSADCLDQFEEPVSRNAGDNGFPFSANVQRDKSWKKPDSDRSYKGSGRPDVAPNNGYGRPQVNSNSYADSRRRGDPTVHASGPGGDFSDGSDDQDLFPPRSSEYICHPKRRNPENLIPPPMVPDAPPPLRKHAHVS